MSDRCELNRQIRADNTLIRELKALIDKLMKAVKMTLTEIARAMEQARQDIIMFTYVCINLSNNFLECVSKFDPAAYYAS